jgi:hypothetical protein
MGAIPYITCITFIKGCGSGNPPETLPIYLLCIKVTRTRSGINGICRRLAPVASKMAHILLNLCPSNHGNFSQCDLSDCQKYLHPSSSIRRSFVLPSFKPPVSFIWAAFAGRNTFPPCKQADPKGFSRNPSSCSADRAFRTNKRICEANHLPPARGLGSFGNCGRSRVLSSARM